MWSRLCAPACGLATPDAFGELFDRYARNVYNFAFRLTGD